MKKANRAIFYFSVLPRKNKCFLVNLKYMTVTWLFKMAKFIWVCFNCPCVGLFLLDSLWTPRLNLKFHHLHEFGICTSSQGGNERWQFMSKFFQFTGVHFLDLNPNSYDNLNNMKLDLNVSIKVKFCANDQGF